MPSSSKRYTVNGGMATSWPRSDAPNAGQIHPASHTEPYVSTTAAKNRRTNLRSFVAAGALLSISLPPVGFWPIVFVAPIPLLWLVRGSRPGRAASM